MDHNFDFLIWAVFHWFCGFFIFDQHVGSLESPLKAMNRPLQKCATTHNIVLAYLPYCARRQGGSRVEPLMRLWGKTKESMMNRSLISYCSVPANPRDLLALRRHHRGATLRSVDTHRHQIWI